MQQATVRTVLNWIEKIAPLETAEEYDNVGLLIGSPEKPVDRVLVALDATPDVIREASDKGAQLLLTHHPLMFHPRKNLREDEYEGAVLCELIRRNISLVSAHTNLDRTMYSGSAAIANKLSLLNIRQSGYLVIGDLPESCSALKLRRILNDILDETAQMAGDANQVIRTLAISGGAYDEGYLEAISEHAQAMLTGEMRHHNAIAAAAQGFVLYAGGHFATEAPLVPVLCEGLQNAMNALQYNMSVYSSCIRPYGGRTL